MKLTPWKEIPVVYKVAGLLVVAPILPLVVVGTVAYIVVDYVRFGIRHGIW